MGIKTTKEKDRLWNYYLTLVKELIVLSDYVELDEANHEVYSVELSKLLMAAASETDVVLKQLCDLLNKKKKHKNIDQYRDTIRKHLRSNFLREIVYIPRHELELHPWTNWIGSKVRNPDWWQAYNKVKHQRHEYFSEATLKNTLNAMAALFVSIVYLEAVKKEEWGQGYPDFALCRALGGFVPRELFLRIDRIAVPAVPIE